MRVIPAYIKNLFASRLFVGSDAPTARAVVHVGDTVYEFQVVSVRINHGQAEMSQTAEVHLYNVDPGDSTQIGYLAPDRSAAKGYQVNGFEGVLMPKRLIEVYAGYGSTQVIMYTGEIDDVQMASQPGEYTVTLTCRDLASRLLYKTAKADDGSYGLLFQNTLIEDIVAFCLTRAGITSYDVQPTGIKCVEKAFTKTKWADIVSWCQQVTNFGFRVDETGHARFFRPDDRQPEYREDIELPFAGDWSGLTYAPVAEGSEVVTDKTALDASGNPVVYTRGTDYEIDYEQGRVRSLPGGRLDGMFVHVDIDYVYPAWHFQAGVDILSLEYTISRRDLHYQIRVIGAAIKDAQGNDTDNHYYGTYQYPEVDDYGVDNDDIDWVEAGELGSDEDCQRLADFAGRMMRKKARIVKFTTPALPWLEVGDVVRITERGSSATMLYHITSLEFDISPDAAIMTVEACIASNL